MQYIFAMRGNKLSQYIFSYKARSRGYMQPHDVIMTSKLQLIPTMQHQQRLLLNNCFQIETELKVCDNRSYPLSEGYIRINRCHGKPVKQRYSSVMDASCFKRNWDFKLKSSREWITASGILGYE